MKHLFDANVWIALCFESHPAHPVARRFREGLTEEDRACFCRAIELTFLRLLTNDHVLKGLGKAPLRNSEALRLYRSLRSQPFVEYLPEPQELEDWYSFADIDQVSPKVWMDAYLAAFAAQSSAQLVTFDNGFKDYQRFGARISILPVS